jgi:hypothetical protein
MTIPRANSEIKKKKQNALIQKSTLEIKTVLIKK